MGVDPAFVLSSSFPPLTVISFQFATLGRRKGGFILYTKYVHGGELSFTFLNRRDAPYSFLLRICAFCESGSPATASTPGVGLDWVEIDVLFCLACFFHFMFIFPHTHEYGKRMCVCGMAGNAICGMNMNVYACMYEYAEGLSF